MNNMMPEPANWTGTVRGPAWSADHPEWIPNTSFASLVSWAEIREQGIEGACAAAVLDHNIWSDFCHWINAHACVATAINYRHGAGSNWTDPAGTPRIEPVAPLPVRYPKEEIVVISDTCSDPAGHPFAADSAYPPSPAVRVSPRNLRITSSSADIDNRVSIALAGTTGLQQTVNNTESIAENGLHTWGRNDLRLASLYTGGQVETIAWVVAWRIALRSSMARDKLDALEFPVTTRRDLQGLVGWHAGGGNIHRVLNPGKTARLEWPGLQQDHVAGHEGGAFDHPRRVDHETGVRDVRHGSFLREGQSLMALIPVPLAGDPTAQSWAAGVATKLNATDAIRLDVTTDVGGNLHILNSVWQGTAEYANGLVLNVVSTGFWIRQSIQMSTDRVIVFVEYNSAGPGPRSFQRT